MVSLVGLNKLLDRVAGIVCERRLHQALSAVSGCLSPGGCLSYTLR